jgi:hypothetical protein
MPKQVSIPIAKMNEPTFNVTLENGAVLAVRTVVIAATQVMNNDDSPLIGPDGKQSFGLTIHNIVAVVQESIDKNEMN